MRFLKEISIIAIISFIFIVALSGLLYLVFPDTYKDYKWVVYIFALVIGIYVNSMMERISEE